MALHATAGLAKASHALAALVLGGITIGSSLSSPEASAQGANWAITKTQWSATDEKNYGEFVRALGETNCNTVDSCLKSAANPYRASDAPGVRFWSDCAKFPYALRAYFAWKNGLPFSYVSAVATADGAGANLRYSPRGNKVVSRRDVIQTGAPLPGIATLNQMLNTVNSAMFRFDPDLESPGVPDFYAVKLDRESLRPGSLLYDPNGHVAVVYKIEADGRVRFMDAHPDNSVTRGTYGKKFARANPGMGAGFKNWRPLQLVGAQRNSAGHYIGGRVVMARHAELADFSTEQFYGTTRSRDGRWSKGTFEVQGQVVDYYDFVRARMAVGDLRYKPVDELRNMMTALCDDLKDRVLAVQAAIDNRLHEKAQPSRLPDNIYGTHGEWESYSTPSRDARLKTSFKELRDRTEEFVSLYRQRSPRVEYQGGNLVADLLAAYDETAAACQFEYVKSDGGRVTLNFNDAVERLFAMSFDPYHCVEHRWGASQPGELSSCRDGEVKRAWYAAEQRLRNQLDRTYDARMNFDLRELQARAPGSGVDRAPDVDVRAYLKAN